MNKLNKILKTAKIAMFIALFAPSVGASISKPLKNAKKKYVKIKKRVKKWRKKKKDYTFLYTIGGLSIIGIAAYYLSWHNEVDKKPTKIRLMLKKFVSGIDFIGIEDQSNIINDDYDQKYEESDDDDDDYVATLDDEHDVANFIRIVQSYNKNITKEQARNTLLVMSDEKRRETKRKMARILLENTREQVVSDIEKKVLKWSDVLGCKEAKNRLQNIQKRKGEKSKRLNVLNLPEPMGIILHGRPGTGKTMLAKVFSIEMKYKYIEITGGDISSGVVGGGVEKVNRIFEEADEACKKEGGAVIFIDEAEGVAAKKNERGGDGAAQKLDILNKFLKKIEATKDKNIIIMAATNHIDMLESSFKRVGRFDEVIEVELPSDEERAEAVESFVREFAGIGAISLNNDINFMKLAKDIGICSIPEMRLHIVNKISLFQDKYVDKKVSAVIGMDDLKGKMRVRFKEKKEEKVEEVVPKNKTEREILSMENKEKVVRIMMEYFSKTHAYFKKGRGRKKWNYLYIIKVINWTRKKRDEIVELEKDVIEEFNIFDAFKKKEKPQSICLSEQIIVLEGIKRDIEKEIKKKLNSLQLELKEQKLDDQDELDPEILLDEMKRLFFVKIKRKAARNKEIHEAMKEMNDAMNEMNDAMNDAMKEGRKAMNNARNNARKAIKSWNTRKEINEAEYDGMNEDVKYEAINDMKEERKAEAMKDMYDAMKEGRKAINEMNKAINEMNKVINEMNKAMKAEARKDMYDAMKAEAMKEERNNAMKDMYEAMKVMKAEYEAINEMNEAMRAEARKDVYDARKAEARKAEARKDMNEAIINKKHPTNRMEMSSDKDEYETKTAPVQEPKSETHLRKDSIDYEVNFIITSEYEVITSRIMSYIAAEKETIKDVESIKKSILSFIEIEKEKLIKRKNDFINKINRVKKRIYYLDEKLKESNDNIVKGRLDTENIVLRNLKNEMKKFVVDYLKSSDEKVRYKLKILKKDSNAH